MQAEKNIAIRTWLKWKWYIKPEVTQAELGSYYDLQSVGYILQHYCNTMVSSLYQNEAKRAI